MTKAWTTACASLVLSILVTPTTLAQRGGGQAQTFNQPDGPREVTVTGIPGVVAAGAKWQLAWQGPDNADGIVGTDDGGLLFAQEQPNQVSKLDKDDRVSVAVRGTHGAGSLTMDAKGRLLAAERTCTDPGRQGRGETTPCTEPTAISVITPERQVLADNYAGKPLGRVNDLIVDRTGGVYFTSGAAYYVSPSRQVTSLGDDLRTNGIMLSPDEKTLYVTNGGVIVAFDRLPDGRVTNRRDFGKLEAGGGGDGLAVDAAGRLYVTSGPGVQVFAPDGKYLGLIPTPRGVIAVAFSGPEKKTLYVVGSGALGPDGKEWITPTGVRNNGKTIYKLPMLAEGFKGRAK
jgi:gluconolactonase